MTTPSLKTSSNGDLQTLNVPSTNEYASVAGRTATTLRDQNEKPPKRVNNFIIPIVLFEVFIILGLTTLASILRFSKFFQIHESRIGCCDYSLMYNKSQEDTGFIISIGENAMYCVNFLVPTGVVVITELLIMYFTDITTKRKKTVITGHGHMNIPVGVRRIFRYTFTYILGALCVSIWTDGMKYLTGRPRPYFFTTCQPDICVEKGCAGFYTISSCTGYQIDTDILSFPSYYASLSSYAAVYVMVYLHSILSFHGSYSLRPTVLSALAAWPLLTGYSRWMSYENHWTDVLAGYIIGLVASIYMCVAMLNSFKEHIPKRRPVVPGLPPPAYRLFDYYANPIPRVPLKSEGGTSVYGRQDSDNDGASSVFEHNPGFQKDLQKNLTEYRKRMYSPYAPSSVGG